MQGRRRLAAGALALASLCAGAVARAQAPAELAVERRGQIEVTGSRIITVDVESPSPIAIITAEEIASSGYSSLELILNNLPQLVADQGSRVSNGATGTSTANLRGLLPGRTLVLLNGRRVVAGSPFALAADLNQVPLALIARVEILTGGASAVHGSDAIAGVVNIILKDKFEGVEGSVGYDFYNHRQKNDYAAGLVRAAGYEVPGDKDRDGATTTAYLLIGGNFAGDRGNAVASFRYASSEALLQTERDYSACALTVFRFGAPDAFVACGGSPAGFPGRFIDLGSRRSLTVADASGNVRAWTTPRDLYNFAPWNYYQRPTERYGFNAFGHYDLGRARFYGEFGFHDDNTVAQIAPSGIFGGLWTVRWENPFLSDAWRSNLTFRRPDGTRGTGPGSMASLAIQRRNVEGGGRQFEFRHTSFREVVGLKGSLREPWDFDVSYQTSRVLATQVSKNDFSISRLARALDAVPDPVTGTPVCASALNGSDPGCRPYDIWRLGGVTQDALDYIHAPAYQRGLTSQTLLSAAMRADLGHYGVRLPWTRDTVEVAFGVERRGDRMELSTDAQFASGDLAGAGASTPPVDGQVSVKESFAEARVPVLDTLSVTGSFRLSEYSTGPRTHTFGVGFNANPASAVRFRGSFQKAVRAANIVELFTPEIQGGWFIFPDDPCSGDAPTLTLSQCQRTGVTASQYGRIPTTPGALGFPAVFGGNPALEPESAKTTTLGVAFTPTKSFSATVDYYDIRVDDFILEGTPEVTFNRCVETGDPVFCSLITRDPALGTLWLAPARLVAVNQNIGSVKVSGLDVAFEYRHGAFSASAVGTWMRSFTFQLYPGANPIQCAGFALGDCLEPRPRWRHRMRARWATPWNVDVSATWRYIHSMRDSAGRLPDVAARNYLDLGAAWAIDRRWGLRLGVDNVTDRDPPITAGLGGGIGNGNTFVQSYDALGRHVSVSVSAKF